MSVEYEEAEVMKVCSWPLMMIIMFLSAVLYKVTIDSRLCMS